MSSWVDTLGALLGTGSWYSTLILCGLLLLSLCKILGIFEHMLYARRHAGEINEDFRKLTGTRRSSDQDELRSVKRRCKCLLIKYGQLFIFDQWTEFRIVRKAHLPSWTIKRLFWVPTLAAFLIIFALTHKGGAGLIASYSAVLLIWSYSAQMFLMHIWLGPYEVFFRKPSFSRENVSPDDLFSTKSQLLWVYMRILVPLLVLGIAAYAASYHSLSWFDPGSFHDAAQMATGTDNNSYHVPAEQTLGFVQMLYFATVTFATVGYGDIVPVTSCARILVATEIGLSFMLVVLFVTTFSVNLSFEDG